LIGSKIFLSEFLAVISPLAHWVSQRFLNYFSLALSANGVMEDQGFRWKPSSVIAIEIFLKMAKFDAEVSFLDYI
jgi:hypothetical protein